MFRITLNERDIIELTIDRIQEIFGTKTGKIRSNACVYIQDEHSQQRMGARTIVISAKTYDKDKK